ncbi:HET-domain-containing protein [Nemania sp. FL0031]|nr:HET-domain-containing protein [Nemania sp. FL0031]
MLRGECHQTSSYCPQGTVKIEQKSFWNLGSANLDSFTSWCVLCQFFVATNPSLDLGPRVPNQTIVVRDVAEENFSQFYSNGRLAPYSPGQLFVVRESVTVSGKFCSLGDAFCAVGSSGSSDVSMDGLARGRIIEPDRIDYGVIRSWISHCKGRHAECLDPSFMPLKVIDCRRRIITKVLDHVTYVALSYVWGNSPSLEEPPTTDGFSMKLPAVVEDAITVTLALGYDYLWVDRYCISQHGGHEKAQEIARMDEIYQGAEVVIIAASGDDPDLGLPGVSRERSISQPRVVTTTHALVSFMSYPLNQILASKWITRGWTYQEVYFECGVYSCYLKEYSKRQLSYDSDALNAFRGIFHMLNRQSTPVRHCGGVPLLNNDLDKQVSTSVADLLGFLRGLCWMAPWDVVVRRPDFPSWSWTGWQFPGGGVDFHQHNFPIYCSLSRFYARCDDKTIPYPIEYGFQATNLLVSSIPNALYMTGNVVTFSYSGRSMSETHCRGSGTSEIWFEHKNNPSRTVGKCAKPVTTHFYRAGFPKGTQSLCAIQIAQSKNPNLISTSQMDENNGNTRKDGPSGFITVLLLLKEIQGASYKFTPDRVFERVGLLVLYFTSFQHFQRSDWSLAVEKTVVIV